MSSVALVLWSVDGLAAYLAGSAVDVAIDGVPVLRRRPLARVLVQVPVSLVLLRELLSMARTGVSPYGSALVLLGLFAGQEQLFMALREVRREVLHDLAALLHSAAH